MYGVLLVMFMTLLMSFYIGLGGHSEPPKLRAEVVAMQMSSWHVAAQQRCDASPCAGGSVDPRNYLTDSVKNSDFVRRNYFRSNFDVSTNYVLTSLTGVGMDIGDVSTGTVSASFHKFLGQNSSSSIGYWNMTTGRIELPSRNYGKTHLVVPGDIPLNLLIGVPNGSPVMLNKVTKH